MRAGEHPGHRPALVEQAHRHRELVPAQEALGAVDGVDDPGVRRVAAPVVDPAEHLAQTHRSAQCPAHQADDLLRARLTGVLPEVGGPLLPRARSLPTGCTRTSTPTPSSTSTRRDPGTPWWCRARRPPPLRPRPRPHTVAPVAGRCAVVADRLRRATHCERVVVVVYGADVPHAHVHLIPLEAGGHLAFPEPVPRPPADLAAMADHIRGCRPAPFTTRRPPWSSSTCRTTSPIPPGSLYVKGGETVVPVINAEIARARRAGPPSSTPRTGTRPPPPTSPRTAGPGRCTASAAPAGPSSTRTLRRWPTGRVFDRARAPARRTATPGLLDARPHRRRA